MSISALKATVIDIYLMREFVPQAYYDNMFKAIIVEFA